MIFLLRNLSYLMYMEKTVIQNIEHRALRVYAGIQTNQFLDSLGQSEFNYRQCQQIFTKSHVSMRKMAQLIGKSCCYSSFLY